jgi:hypothetical protein
VLDTLLAGTRERLGAQVVGLSRALAYPDGDQRDDVAGTRALIRFTRERAVETEAGRSS